MSTCVARCFSFYSFYILEFGSGSTNLAWSKKFRLSSGDLNFSRSNMGEDNSVRVKFGLTPIRPACQVCMWYFHLFNRILPAASRFEPIFPNKAPNFLLCKLKLDFFTLIVIVTSVRCSLHRHCQLSFLTFSHTLNDKHSHTVWLSFTHYLTLSSTTSSFFHPLPRALFPFPLYL